MSRLRSIALREQRELTTFLFAVAVFLLTLLALELRDARTGVVRASAVSPVHLSASTATHDTHPDRT